MQYLYFDLLMVISYPYYRIGHSRSSRHHVYYVFNIISPLMSIFYNCVTTKTCKEGVYNGNFSYNFPLTFVDINSVSRLWKINVLLPVS